MQLKQQQAGRRCQRWESGRASSTRIFRMWAQPTPTRVEDDARLCQVQPHRLSRVGLVLEQRAAPGSVHGAGGACRGGEGRGGAEVGDDGMVPAPDMCTAAGGAGVFGLAILQPGLTIIGLIGSLGVLCGPLALAPHNGAHHGRVAAAGGAAAADMAVDSALLAVVAAAAEVAPDKKVHQLHAQHGCGQFVAHGAAGGRQGRGRGRRR